MNKLKLLSNLIIIPCALLFLGGCATLSYVGNDYQETNVQTVKTQEDFIFDVYKKTTDNINLKIGVSKTPITELLALYVQIENTSYETPYVFKVENLRIYQGDKELQFITTNNYLNIYQAQEASSMASMSNLGSTITNMTGMMSNYNDFNQTMAQNSAQQTNESAFSRIEEIGNNILSHSIRYSSTISPRKSQYYYFFFEDPIEYPIVVKYKDLVYQFKL